MALSAAHRLRRGPVAVALLALLAAVACDGKERSPASGATADGKAAPEVEGTAGHEPSAAELRKKALRAARVWQRPLVPISSVNLAENTPGPDGFKSSEEVSCRFVLAPVGGVTQKFNCELPGGDVVKVKYGTANPELQAEVAASRLLTALGFGADRMYVVKKVICAGCPQFPFHSLKCVTETGLKAACLPGGLDYGQSRQFDPAVIERRFPGDPIEATKGQGWAWFELDRIDPRFGGSSRAEVDALRLLAVVLAHWDNKSENQRLACRSGLRADGACARPFAIIQDLGGTFGPTKADLRNWREFGVWSDPVTCAVSLKSLPFAGATFQDRRISEVGRQMLLGLLEQLSDRQLEDLFTTSRMTAYDHISAAGRDARAWVAAFQDKVRQIREAGPCPQ